MRKLFTIALCSLLSISVSADNELLVGDINLSATVDQIGGASIKIPIEVPAGINGMQPNLALVYNSHRAYGLAGWGWDLTGISVIQRTGKTFYHDNVIEGIKYDNTDNLLLDGERLLLKSGSSLMENSTYCTERESFNLITMTGGNGITVQSKDGYVSTYGDTNASQLRNDDGWIKAWYISKCVDNNGNYITYQYDANSQHHEICISKIEYTGNATTAPFASVEFVYESIPHERFSYDGGTRFSLTKILKSIKVKRSDDLLYTYLLTYNNTDVHSKLISVMKVAANGDYYNPTNITWKATGTSNEKETPVSISRKDSLVFADFTGDGLTDIFSCGNGENASSSCVLYTNTTQDGVVSFASKILPVGNKLSKYKALDYNGDGRVDLAGIYNGNRITYLISTGTSFSTTTNSIEAPGGNFNVGDFDGDGCDEIIPVGVNKMYNYNGATVSFTGINAWSDSQGRIYSMSEGNVPLDFNGNGKNDLMIFTDALCYIYEFDESSSKFNQIGLDYLNSMVDNFYQYSKLYFGDFNGDGCTDLLHLGFESSSDYRIMARIFVSRGSDLVMEQKQYVGVTEVFVKDFNNDGISDIAYLTNENNTVQLYVGVNNCDEFVLKKQSFSTSPSNFNTFFFEDVHGIGRADFVMFNNKSKITTKQLFTDNTMLVDKVTDGLGNVYDFTYKSITDDNVYTNTRVGGASVNPLVQPYYVVSKYTAPYTSLSYQYKNGRYHTKGKGFLGFEGLTIKDNLNNTITNNINGITTNHLYNYPITTTVKSLDGDTISHLKYRFTVREMGGKRIFPHHSGYEYTNHLTGIKETCVSMYENNGNLDNQTITRGGWQEVSKFQYVNAGSWCPNKINNSLTYNVYNGTTSPYRRTFYKYNDHGDLIRQTIDTLYTDTYRLVYQYEYDTFGNVTKEIVSGSGQTRTCSYTYSADGRFLLTSIDELGQTTTNTYDPNWGTLLTQSTNAGTTENSYDSFGRLRQTIYPDSTICTITSQYVSNVPDVRFISHETHTNSSPITTYYNAAGKTLFTEKVGHNNKLIFTAYTYYPNGLEKYVSEPYFSSSISAAASQAFTSDNATFYTYDEYQRPYSIENAEGTTLYTYDGLTTTVNTPSVNRVTKLSSEGFTEYEQIGPPLMPLAERPSLISLHKKVTYTYYPTGQVKTATPDGGSAVTMQYDVQGNRTKIVDPDAGTITNTYNAFGQPLTRSQSIHNETPITTTYSYNPTSGMLRSEVITGDATTTTTYSYNSIFKDKPYRIQGNEGYTSYTYDDYGNIKAYHNYYTQKTMRLTTYHDKGLVTRHQMAYAGLNNIYYAYDSYGNMTSERFNSTVAWELLEQNARGQVVRERRGGIVTTYTYDNCGRITSIVAPNIMNLHYTYDSFGNVSTKTDFINNQNIEYTYDYQNRLTSWTVNGNDTQTITYDEITGNIISKSDLGESSEFVYNSSSKPHALRGINNVSNDWADTNIAIDYTDFSKVESILRGDDNYQIVYNVDKNRVCSQKTVSGVTTTRYYMPNHEVVVNSLGEETYIIYLCNGSIAIHDKTAGTKTLYHGYYDAQGSLIALTDNSGNVVARFAYDPWGCRVSPADWSQSVDSPNVLGIERGYTMHEHLDEFELINMSGRVYDPAIAQFLSPDPYIQDDSNWLNYNRYSYCFNNPTKYVDPDGEWVITSFLVGMAVSAAIDYGMQVFYNFANGMKGKEAWVDNVDFFDVAVSGAFGGATSGLGAAAIADYSKYIDLGQMVLSSTVSYKGGEWHVSLSHKDLIYGAAMNYINKEMSDFLYSKISQHIKDLKLSKSSTEINDKDYANDIKSRLSSSLKNEMPYKVEGKINPNEPKIGWRLEGNGIQSYLKGPHRIYYNSKTKEIIKILPVSDAKYKKAIRSFLREHPRPSYLHISKPTG